MTKKDMYFVGIRMIARAINSLYDDQTFEELSTRKRVIRGEMYMLKALEIIDEQQYADLNKMLTEAYAKNIERFH